MGEAWAWLGIVVAVIGAVATLWRKLRKGAAAEVRAKAKDEDYEHADDIRDAVARDRDKRVHQFKDRGYRDGKGPV